MSNILATKTFPGLKKWLKHFESDFEHDTIRADENNMVPFEESNCPYRGTHCNCLQTDEIVMEMHLNACIKPNCRTVNSNGSQKGLI